MITIFALTGLLLIFLEFFLPGTIMAIGGIIMLLTSLALFYFQVSEIILFTAYAISLAVVVFLTIVFILKRIKAGKIVNTSDQEGFVACVYPKEMIDRVAIVTSDLKPAGYIEIDGNIFSALSSMDYIEKGTKVRVIDGQGAYLIVNQEKINHVQ